MEENIKLEKIEEWTKLDIELHNKLEEFNRLKEERDKLINEAEKMGHLTAKMKERMTISLEHYNKLSNEIRELKVLARTINEKT